MDPIRKPKINVLFLHCTPERWVFDRPSRLQTAIDTLRTKGGKFVFLNTRGTTREEVLKTAQELKEYTEQHPEDYWFVLRNRNRFGLSLPKMVLTEQITRELLSKFPGQICFADVSEDGDDIHYRVQQAALFLSQYRFIFDRLYNQQQESK